MTFTITAGDPFKSRKRVLEPISNGIAVAMLFFTGTAYGRGVGRASLGIGIGMVVLGGILVALTMALGGQAMGKA